MENNSNMRVIWDSKSMPPPAPYVKEVKTPTTSTHNHNQEQKKQTHKRKSRLNNVSRLINMSRSPKRTKISEDNRNKINQKIMNINKQLLYHNNEEFHQKYINDLKKIDEKVSRIIKPYNDRYLFLDTEIKKLNEELIKVDKIRDNIDSNYNKELNIIEKEYKKQYKIFKDNLNTKKSVQESLFYHLNSNINYNNYNNRSRLPPKLDLGVEQPPDNNLNNFGNINNFDLNNLFNNNKNGQDYQYKGVLPPLNNKNSKKNSKKSSKKSSKKKSSKKRKRNEN